MTPLDMFIDRWNSVGMLAPFFDVINTPADLDDMPDIWASAIYHTPTRAEVTMGSRPFVQEDGTIIVALFARAGTGRSVLDDLVNQVRRYFAGWASGDTGDTAARCYFTQVNGPEDLNPETDGNWWQVALTVPYEVYTNSVTWDLPAPGAPPVVTDEDVDAWEAAVLQAGGSLSAARKEIVVNLVTALKRVNVWNKLERLWLHAAENQQQALIDLVVRQTALLSNPVPEFVADYGYKSRDGDIVYINYNWRPCDGVKYTAGDSHIAAFNSCDLLYDQTTNNQRPLFGCNDGPGKDLLPGDPEWPAGTALTSYTPNFNANAKAFIQNMHDAEIPTSEFSSSGYGYAVQGTRNGLTYNMYGGHPVREYPLLTNFQCPVKFLYSLTWNSNTIAASFGNDMALMHFGAGLTNQQAGQLYYALAGLYLNKLGFVFV